MPGSGWCEDALLLMVCEKKGSWWGAVKDAQLWMMWSNKTWVLQAVEMPSFGW